MPDPLDVASGPRRRSLAQIGSGGSSFLDKDQFLSTTTWPTRRAGSSQMEQRLPSSGLHWMTCVPTRQSSFLIVHVSNPYNTTLHIIDLIIRFFRFLLSFPLSNSFLL